MRWIREQACVQGAEEVEKADSHVLDMVGVEVIIGSKEAPPVVVGREPGTRTSPGCASKSCAQAVTHRLISGGAGPNSPSPRWRTSSLRAGQVQLLSKPVGLVADSTSCRSSGAYQGLPTVPNRSKSRGWPIPTVTPLTRLSQAVCYTRVTGKTATSRRRADASQRSGGCKGPLRQHRNDLRALPAGRNAPSPGFERDPHTSARAQAGTREAGAADATREALVIVGTQAGCTSFSTRDRR